MEKPKFNYDLVNAVNGTYLGSLFDCPEIVIGEDMCFLRADLERNNCRKRRICRVINIEPDSQSKETYIVNIKPIESWQFGTDFQRPSEDWKLDNSGSDGWLRR